MEPAGTYQFSPTMKVGHPTKIRSGSRDTAHRLQAWHAGYMAALFENDRDALLGRITQAKQLILSRERELLSEKSDLGRSERDALNNALHALEALRACIQM
jgi:hypothetical protein